MLLKSTRLYLFVYVTAFLTACSTAEQDHAELYPMPGQTDISPDTHLKIHFDSPPGIGTQGKIRVYDSENDTLVDVLDMSIPAGPTERRRNPDAIYTPMPYVYDTGMLTNANTKPGTPSGVALANSDTFQLTIIGGFTDAFHFYPVIVHENTATICLHHNLLRYDKTYYVQIDSGVLNSADGSFIGIQDKSWSFSTRAKAPDLSSGRLVVDHTGNGDFSTLQGALDYVPEFSEDTIEIHIKNGTYEELIYFRNKSNLIITGENRDSVMIQYANNEVFNPHPWDIKTNEWPGTFPSRRAAFAVDNCSNVQLRNLTVKTLLKGQAEGLLINGDKILVKDVSIYGDGDALQTNGRAYFENVSIDGGGDMILGRGPAFFKNCDFVSPGPFMWIRNTQANHGNIFVNCSFTGTRPSGADLARAPENKGYTYPYAEAVLLNCQLENIRDEGWGPVGGNLENLHYWEYNSTNIKDGKPADVSKRKDYSRQLTLEDDEKLIKDYSDPSFVLEGWTPNLD